MFEMFDLITTRGLMVAFALSTTACGSTLYVGGDVHPLRPAAVYSGWAYVVGDPALTPSYYPYVPAYPYAVYGSGVVSY